MRWKLMVLLVVSLGAVPLAVMADPARPADWSKVDAALVAELEAEGSAGFYAILSAQADLSEAALLGTKVGKTSFVLERLRQVAAETQGPLLGYLRRQGVAFHPRYIENMIEVEGGRGVVEWLAARPDVAQIVSLPDPQLDPVYIDKTPKERRAIEWNIVRVHAPEVWAMGIHGEGMVVASNDTGVAFGHPALVGKYRGTLGRGQFDHNYNWWDGEDGYPYPRDYDGHGTHTTGIMVGDDGGENQVGVAPGAQWIACGGLGGTDTIDCFEFFLAPWDLNGEHPKPEKAPDAINNSWYDLTGFDYRPIIQALNAAGIAVIKSAGNQGPDCGSITNPGYVPEIIATAAFEEGDKIASFSSRGPTSNYGATILKPEVAAPGVNIRSSVPGGRYEGGWSGTSMAAPHSTGLVALMWSAAPCLRGDVPNTKQIMMKTAEPKLAIRCPPFIGHPNDLWGWGILDDLSAVETAMDYCGSLGRLEGTVTDAGTGTPLYGVEVRAEASYGRTARSDWNGFYALDVPADSYTVGASVYGYEPTEIEGVGVEAGATTVLDIAMTALPVWTVDGYVRDAETNAPLAAVVYLTDAPLDAVETDPETGYYSLVVAEGTWHLKAKRDDYVAEIRAVTVDGDLCEDFYLAPKPCILLIDDDEDDPDVRAYYREAFDALGEAYGVWDVLTEGDPTGEYLTGHQMVVWWTGLDWNGTFTRLNEEAAALYLDGGGRLLLSSQDYLYDYELTPFGEDYLHIASYTSDVTQTVVTGENVFEGLGPYVLEYPFTDYSDIVEPDAEAQVAFVGDHGNTAVSYDGGTFRTVFLGFPLEAVPDLTHRVAILARLVDWFGGCELSGDGMHAGSAGPEQNEEGGEAAAGP